MKYLPFVGLMAVMAMPAAGASVTNGVEEELVGVENSWSQAAISRDLPTLQRFYADEYVFTDADGTVSNKTKELADIGSGAFRLTSYHFEDLRVHVYGNVAVVTGQNTIAGVWENIKRDISGPYRFTDVFVRRNGRWQCVASQASRIDER